MRAILVYATLPAALPCWALGMLTVLCGIARDPRWDENYVLSVVFRPWVQTFWKYSTALPRMVFYQDRDETAAADTRVERHEHIHVFQMENNMMVSMLIGKAFMFNGDLLLGGAIWVSGALWILMGYLTAGMRYGFKSKIVGGREVGGWYRDAEHERSAYAQTDLPFKLGQSWAELRYEDE